MKNVETCTVTIRMEQNFDISDRFDPETIVKSTWTRIIPWFTERHGVRTGTIQIGDGETNGHKVTFEWKYETDEDYTSVEEDYYPEIPF